MSRWESDIDHLSKTHLLRGLVAQKHKCRELLRSKPEI